MTLTRSTTSTGWADRLLPRQVTAWVRVTAWSSLLANALLIVTGGAVRLTGSGLGCPTWPRCTDASWTNTPQMGLHGYIEFGNRTLTFVLAAVAVLTVLAVLRQRATRPDLFRLALTLALGIPLQAIVGGITVRTGLNPWVVGIHLLISTGLVALATVLLNRVRRASLPAVAAAEPSGALSRGRGAARAVLGALAGLTLVLLYLGTLVTGTGPHAGDAGEVVRHAFDAVVVTRAHSVPAYLLLGATVVGLVLARRDGWPAPVQRMLGLLLGVLLVQGLVGYYQYLNGVPEAVVALHLVGAAALTAVAASTVEKGLHLSAHTGSH